MRKNLFEQGLPGLRFNVAQLLKEPTGASRTYTIESEVVGRVNEDLALAEPLAGQIRLLRAGRDILVTGSLDTAVVKPCDRCLEPFAAPLTLDLEENFQPIIDVISGTMLPVDPDADEATLITDQHLLDLNEVVRQELIVTSAGIRYCRPDCQGICPFCGQDLNEAQCDCRDELIDQRWAGLLELQLDE